MIPSSRAGVPLQSPFGVHQVGLRLLQPRLSADVVNIALFHPVIEELGIDLADGLSPLHLRIEIGEEPLHGAGVLGADLHRFHRGKVAGSRDDRYQVFAQP